ncbi:PREDICTED: uncharacterized protein LOC105359618 [Ceratosolen solmsi marchali]|uniref:Uncharacterized protein LOC105359618 n=1 Tax=Ceratosolen solmsi marchali TaxID=326594 RepID=A0AAJ6YBN9_9HYME|nr:PREDICTED: uncharacterized protein LOC105359618 [Ceratosolen solmsi marchali]
MFILLSVLLMFASANPIIVAHFHRQISVPITHGSEYERKFYQFDHEIERVDNENDQQSFNPGHNSYYSTHNQQNSAIVKKDESRDQHDFIEQQQHDYSAYTKFNSDSHDYGDEAESEYDKSLEQQHVGEHQYVQSIPVSEHVEVTKPVAIPVYKEIGVPVLHPVKINIPHPITIGIPQPYPVAVPVSQPLPVQITKTIAVPVEKKVPYAVEKHIPIPVEKLVPIKIEKHIPVPVYKPYPIKIPVYKTIYHHLKETYSH